jgi:hypothetical protein
MEILEQLEQEDGGQESPVPKELQEKAEGSQILMMSVREWLKDQTRKMGLDFSGKSESEMLGEICKLLKKDQESSKT